ncbi:hypothetical protein CLU79DRAFT_745973 [Phycomyces nitens]|nr:hypothetical protein CLU79DRAFT_745973 [Phycomyces nitens]
MNQNEPTVDRLSTKRKRGRPSKKDLLTRLDNKKAPPLLTPHSHPHPHSYPHPHPHPHHPMHMPLLAPMPASMPLPINTPISAPAPAPLRIIEHNPPRQPETPRIYSAPAFVPPDMPSEAIQLLRNLNTKIETLESEVKRLTKSNKKLTAEVRNLKEASKDVSALTAAQKERISGELNELFCSEKSTFSITSSMRLSVLEKFGLQDNGPLKRLGLSHISEEWSMLRSLAKRRVLGGISYEKWAGRSCKEVSAQWFKVDKGSKPILDAKVAILRSVFTGLATNRSNGSIKDRTAAWGLVSRKIQEDLVDVNPSLLLANCKFWIGKDKEYLSSMGVARKLEEESDSEISSSSSSLESDVSYND